MSHRALLTALLTLLVVVHAELARSETWAITHAHIYSMGAAGEIGFGTILIDDERIVAVGADLRVPSGARIVDARGRIVTPGLVAAGTPLSQIEMAGVPSLDDTQTRGRRLSAAFDVQYSANPNSVLIPEIRRGGVTRAVVVPSLSPVSDSEEHAGLMFGGRASVIQLDPDYPMLVKPHVAMVLRLGLDGAQAAGGGRGTQAVLLRSIFDQVRHFVRNKPARERYDIARHDLSYEDIQALIPVLQGYEPLLVGVHREADILAALEFAREQRVRIILHGAEEGWRIASQIAAAKTPVLLDADEDLGVTFETLGATFENAARLHAAGVLIAIEPGGSDFPIRTPRFNAGLAVAHGLPYAAALAAITINPAQIWGVSPRFGSLDAGKDADLVLWSGDPLEATSHADSVFIRGREQPMGSRSTQLRDRYLRPATAYPQAYPQAYQQ